MSELNKLEQPSLPLLSKVTGDALLKTTPMFQQFLELKVENEDCLLFFRMGDFYELFFDDAVIASKELDIALTSRGKYDGKPVPMCGVPFHAYMPYLEKLTKKKYKIAICEQVETPEQAKIRGGSKALVKREVVRIVTPGTLTEEVLLDASINNFLLSIYNDIDNIGLSWLDISTGEIFTQSTNRNNLFSIVAKIKPNEILVSNYLEENDFLDSLKKNIDCTITPTLANKLNSKKAEKLICMHYGIKSLNSFGKFNSEEVLACWFLLDYVSMTQKRKLPTISFPRSIKSDSSMMIDASTRKSLEINQNMSGSLKGSLIGSINMTLTAVGARRLDKDLSSPLTNINEINARLDMIEYFKDEEKLRKETREILKSSADVDRAKARISLSRGGPRDLKSIYLGINSAQRLGGVIKNNSNTKKPPQSMKELLISLKKCDVLCSTLKKALSENLPILLRDGGFIKSGYSEKLDNIRSYRDKSRTHILNLEALERKKTKINSLKIKYNNATGYFFEVTQLQKDKLLKCDEAERFIPRQSLKGVARFTSEELSNLSESIINAANEAIEIEISIFEDIKNTIIENSQELAELSYSISRIDVASSLAELSSINNFVRPNILEDQTLNIVGGRHPSVELAMIKNREGQFHSNNCLLKVDDIIWLITGPNMAGKSTFLRQNAIICILAQAGAYVPADKADIGIIDSLYSRVGSSDDLASGRSTFMVEMLETAAILNQASSKSLVIMDEVGRGTSTYDGLSIAWSILEHLHDKTQCRTLFATHYHELSNLSKTLSKMSCHTMKVKEWEDKVIFLYTVIEGIAKGSYGIHVASLAGVPKEVLKRAKNILETFENKKLNGVDEKNKNVIKNASISKDVINLINDINSIDLDSISPKEALDKLYLYSNIINQTKKNNKE